MEGEGRVREEWGWDLESDEEVGALRVDVVVASTGGRLVY